MAPKNSVAALDQLRDSALRGQLRVLVSHWGLQIVSICGCRSLCFWILGITGRFTAP